MEINEMDFASFGLLFALATIYYGSFSGDIQYHFWLAPLLTVLTLFACWLLVRPQKYSQEDLLIYFGTGFVLLLIFFLGKLDFNYSVYLFAYLALALIGCLFTYFGVKELRSIGKISLKRLERLRQPMILFIVLACLICFLYFNNVIWNWGSEEGEVGIYAFQTLLHGASPYSKLYTMVYSWANGTVTPYAYFPSTLLYYGLCSVLPVSPISVTPDFSNLKAGTLIITIIAAILLLKTFKQLGHESVGRFLSILYVFVFGFTWGGLDDIHMFTAFSIILTTYFLTAGRKQICLLAAGFAALTQPIGTLFSAFVIVHVFRKTEPGFSNWKNWKNIVALIPAVAVMMVFVFWNVQGFFSSIFEWYASRQGGFAATYFGTTSVANLTYFFSPIIGVIGAKTFFIAKVMLTLLFGVILSLKFTKTITKTIFSAAVFILTWLLFVNNGISVMYLQEATVTILLLAGLIMINSLNAKETKK